MLRARRQVPWSTQLAMFLMLAWLFARTVNVVLEDALLVPPSYVPRPVASAPPAAGATLDRAVLARVLGVPATEQGKADAAPTPSPLRVKLLGTLVSEARPAWSVASLQDLASSKTTTVMSGDILSSGAEVVAIERGRVVVRVDGRLEFIDATPSEPSPRSPVSARQLDGNTYELSRAEVTRALGNLAELSTQARLVPAFKNGAMQGFKVFGIRAGSFYEKLGVVEGDVIQRIDGFDLQNPERLLELYAKLRDASRIDVELARNGATVRKTYVLR